MPTGTDTPLDRMLKPVEQQREAQSAFRLLPDGPEAFAIRAQSAIVAGRSIDVQTYIWHDDMTGAYLAHKLVEAADRGVRVRLLVDDMDARGRNFAFAALAAHPNIAVRLFNPFATRSGMLRVMFEAIGSFSRINRRMHNKSWIVDNRIAVVGGRNLGDEYFGGSDGANFVDLDFALAGPIVRDASASFDRYWNATAARPMSALSPRQVTDANLSGLRVRLARASVRAEASEFARELRGTDAIRRLLTGDWPMHWAARYRFVADDPKKIEGRSSGLHGSHVLALIAPLVRSARSSVTLISPYFVPGGDGTELLVTQVAAGRLVRILTNSLAANDVAVVYGGYSKWREPLLRGGVQLWELKPVTGGEVDSSMFGSGGASLHTKAMVVDASTVFVGSYNLDARSTSLNSEQGVFVEESEIARQLEAIFLTQSSGGRAWSVTLENDRLRWNDGATTHGKPPAASPGRRFQAWLARILPVESQL